MSRRRRARGPAPAPAPAPRRPRASLSGFLLFGFPATQHRGRRAAHRAESVAASPSSPLSLPPSRALLTCHTTRHHLLLVRPRPLARPSDSARAAVRLRVALHAFPFSLSPSASTPTAACALRWHVLQDTCASGCLDHTRARVQTYTRTQMRMPRAAFIWRRGLP